MTIKKKYLINGFRFMMDSFSKYIQEYDFTFLFPKEGAFDFITNFILFRKKLKKGELKECDIIHINNWENLLNIPNKSKRKNQIWISESHGFHFGLNDKRALEDSSFIKKLWGYFLSKFVSRKIRKNLTKFDIVYAAIPNLVGDLKKIRPDATWLPNIIDLDTFYPRKKIKTEGNPSVFFPTRLHKMKTPERGFEIFRMIKQSFPDAKLHLIRYPKRYSQYHYYKDQLDEFKDATIWHDFMLRDKLPEFYSSFDLIIGSFGKGVLSLVELEAMACGATVVAHDDYEIIKVKLDDLSEFALKLMKNKLFKDNYTRKCREYVTSIHSPENVTKIHLMNLKMAKSN